MQVHHRLVWLMVVILVKHKLSISEINYGMLIYLLINEMREGREVGVCVQELC